MLKPRYANEPLSGAGAQLVDGRFNRIGRSALYLSADPQTAYAEYIQNLFDRPGLMCSYDVDLAPVVDLTDNATRSRLSVLADAIGGRWVGLANPPGQQLAERLIVEGNIGALYPSAQRDGGVNLVVWGWNDASTNRIVLVDRMGEAPTKPAT